MENKSKNTFKLTTKPYKIFKYFWKYRKNHSKYKNWNGLLKILENIEQFWLKWLKITQNILKISSK